MPIKGPLIPILGRGPSSTYTMHGHVMGLDAAHPRHPVHRCTFRVVLCATLLDCPCGRIEQDRSRGSSASGRWVWHSQGRIMSKNYRRCGTQLTLCASIIWFPGRAFSFVLVFRILRAFFFVFHFAICNLCFPLQLFLDFYLLYQFYLHLYLHLNRHLYFLWHLHS